MKFQYLFLNFELSNGNCVIVYFSYKKTEIISLMDEAQNERETLHEIFGKYENHD